MARLPTVAYIAGDVHLGAADGGGAGFVPWLDHLATLPPARLVLLGDLFEFWVEHPASAAVHAPVLRRLRALRQRGWCIALVRGNRELVAGRLLECLAGARLAQHLDVPAGGRVVRVVHGDSLIDDVGYRAYRAAMTTFPLAVLRLLVPGGLHAVVARWLRRRSAARQRQRPYRIRLDPRRVRAAARGADALVAGHIHQAWRRPVGGVDLTLVGDWPGAAQRWVEVTADGALIQCHRQAP